MCAQQMCAKCQRRHEDGKGKYRWRAMVGNHATAPVSMALWLALNIHASNTITRHRTTDNVVCSSLWRPSFIKADSLSCRAGKLPHPANPHDINFRVRLHRPCLFMGCPAVSPRHCRVLRHKNPRPVRHRPRNCPPRATGPTGL